MKLKTFILIFKDHDIYVYANMPDFVVIRCNGIVMYDVCKFLLSTFWLLLDLLLQFCGDKSIALACKQLPLGIAIWDKPIVSGI